MTECNAGPGNLCCVLSREGSYCMDQTMLIQFSTLWQHIVLVSACCLSLNIISNSDFECDCFVDSCSNGLWLSTIALDKSLPHSELQSGFKDSNDLNSKLQL